MRYEEVEVNHEISRLQCCRDDRECGSEKT